VSGPRAGFALGGVAALLAAAGARVAFARAQGAEHDAVEPAAGASGPTPAGAVVMRMRRGDRSHAGSRLRSPSLEPVSRLVRNGEPAHHAHRT